MKTLRKSKKSKFVKIVLMTGTLIILFMGILVVTLLTQHPEDLKISNIDLSTINKGVYIGDADNGFIKARVSVTIDKGIIQNIAIVKHDHLLGKRAEVIIDDIIEQQSLQVDAITSATYSSEVICKAVENALRKGEKQ